MATHLELEIKQLKVDVLELWDLVINQYQKARKALNDFDVDLATEVKVNEKRVNALDLKVDRFCENILALYHPVAIDLRFVLACYKINFTLERIGDYATGVAKLVKNMKTSNTELIEISSLLEMCDQVVDMLVSSRDAFDQEDAKAARALFIKDEKLDTLHKTGTPAIATYIRDHIEQLEDALAAFAIMKKVERSGDQLKNIAEEIVFFIEAKVLRHRIKEAKSGQI